MENQTIFDKKTKIIISVMALIIVILVVVLLIPKKKVIEPVLTTTPVVEQTAPETITKVPENILATTTIIKDKFREEVPVDIIVPDKDTKLSEEQKKEIAIPTVVVPSAPGVESSFRSFDIRAEGGVFIPNKIIARVGDTVHINFTAVDKAYDIVFPSYNMKQSANAGQTRILEFQAVAEGSFLYYCDSCGGETSVTKGNIIIAK